MEKEEDFEIEDYELPFSLKPDMLLWEINALCRMVQEIEGTPLGYELSEIQAKWFHNISEFFGHKDEICHYYVPDSASLAEYLVMEEHRFGELPPELIKHIDFIPTVMNWNKATNTSLRPAACSAIGKAVVAFGGNACLHCQPWQVQRGRACGRLVHAARGLRRDGRTNRLK
ncbi:antirestriction protein ArdA [Faecalicatena contorta]|uniref:antirestriction protein ArdA n=1 Tax=Faecalicatena contorta TaxID=39482 RepID=UPI001FA6E011|nr:antirestriction protein ArdA [Faecalicatena contorta]